MSRLQPIPDTMYNQINRDVLAFLEGKSAHSDLASALFEAAGPLGDVRFYSSDPDNYGYVILAVEDVVFGVACGMSEVSFRLDETYKERALETGARDATELGPDWAAFRIFRSDYPAVDLVFWTRKAYLMARGSDPS